MATGTVSSVGSDNWQLITSTTLSSAGNFSFTGISGYKTLLAVFDGSQNGGNTGGGTVRLNGGSMMCGGYVFRSGTQFDGSSGTSGTVPIASYVSGVSGYAKIENADKSGPHLIEVFTTGGMGGGFVDGAAVTQVEIRADYNFASGGICKLYGIAA